MNLQDVKIALEHFKYLEKLLPPPTPADFNAKFNEEKAIYDREKAELLQIIDVLTAGYDQMLIDIVEDVRDLLLCSMKDPREDDTNEPA